jgi:hypothetical protein
MVIIMELEFDDYSWEQVYGLMRCSTKFDRNLDNDSEEDITEIEYFNYE